ncbi:hypothetical protein CLOP_g5055 [Closterium sp. NIES-67]|nr:hypothetical protein CLOP_g5055 [Closterium sp. NIES-67]
MGNSPSQIRPHRSPSLRAHRSRNNSHSSSALPPAGPHASAKSPAPLSSSTNDLRPSSTARRLFRPSFSSSDANTLVDHGKPPPTGVHTPVGRSSSTGDAVEGPRKAARSAEKAVLGGELAERTERRSSANFPREEAGKAALGGVRDGTFKQFANAALSGLGGPRRVDAGEGLWSSSRDEQVLSLLAGITEADWSALQQWAESGWRHSASAGSSSALPSPTTADAVGKGPAAGRAEGADLSTAVHPCASDAAAAAGAGNCGNLTTITATAAAAAASAAAGGNGVIAAGAAAGVAGQGARSSLSLHRSRSLTAHRRRPHPPLVVVPSPPPAATPPRGTTPASARPAPATTPGLINVYISSRSGFAQTPATAYAAAPPSAHAAFGSRGGRIWQEGGEGVGGRDWLRQGGAPSAEDDGLLTLPLPPINAGESEQLSRSAGGGRVSGRGGRKGGQERVISVQSDVIPATDSLDSTVSHSTSHSTTTHLLRWASIGALHSAFGGAGQPAVSASSPVKLRRSKSRGKGKARSGRRKEQSLRVSAARRCHSVEEGPSAFTAETRGHDESGEQGSAVFPREKAQERGAAERAEAEPVAGERSASGSSGWQVEDLFGKLAQPLLAGAGGTASGAGAGGGPIGANGADPALFRRPSLPRAALARSASCSQFDSYLSVPPPSPATGAPPPPASAAQLPPALAAAAIAASAKAHDCRITLETGGSAANCGGVSGGGLFLSSPADSSPPPSPPSPEFPPGTCLTMSSRRVLPAFLRTCILPRAMGGVPLPLPLPPQPLKSEFKANERAFLRTVASVEAAAIAAAAAAAAGAAESGEVGDATRAAAARVAEGEAGREGKGGGRAEEWECNGNTDGRRGMGGPGERGIGVARGAETAAADGGGRGRKREAPGGGSGGGGGGGGGGVGNGERSRARDDWCTWGVSPSAAASPASPAVRPLSRAASSPFLSSLLQQQQQQQQRRGMPRSPSPVLLRTESLPRCIPPCPTLPLPTTCTGIASKDGMGGLQLRVCEGRGGLIPRQSSTQPNTPLHPTQGNHTQARAVTLAHKRTHSQATARTSSQSRTPSPSFIHMPPCRLASNSRQAQGEGAGPRAHGTATNGALIPPQPHVSDGSCESHAAHTAPPARIRPQWPFSPPAAARAPLPSLPLSAKRTRSLSVVEMTRERNRFLASSVVAAAAPAPPPPVAAAAAPGSSKAAPCPVAPSGSSVASAERLQLHRAASDVLAETLRLLGSSPSSLPGSPDGGTLQTQQRRQPARLGRKHSGGCAAAAEAVAAAAAAAAAGQGSSVKAAEEGGMVEKGRVAVGSVTQERLLEHVSGAYAALLRDTTPNGSLVGEYLLSALLSLLDSSFGFIASVLHNSDGTPYIKTHAISDIAWTDGLRKWHAMNAQSGLVFANMHTLFGAPVTSRQPVISNHPPSDPRYSGTPPGHAPVHCFLGVPLLVGSNIVGMYAVANRPGAYSTTLLDALHPLTQAAASIVWTIQQRCNSTLPRPQPTSCTASVPYPMVATTPSSHMPTESCGNVGGAACPDVAASDTLEPA